MPRVLAICLDGYEETLGRQLMAEGRMPVLKALADSSACYWLDHGPAMRTGLAGEHIATGLSPEHAGRWAAVHFDPATYAIRQEGTSLVPFTATLHSKVVVFDPPYFDLARVPRTQGIVGWGAHDPGVAVLSRPRELLAESLARFGTYPASDFIYGTPWNSVDRTRQMAARLTAAVGRRTQVAQWLFGERCPEWSLGLLTISEAHSAIEGLWHGVDTQHPLFGCESAEAAGEGVRAVYAAIDTLIGAMQRQFPDAIIVVFSMHGMGSNDSDAGSMLLLAELLYRRAFGKPYFNRTGDASPSLQGRPALAAADTWNTWISGGFPAAEPAQPDALWKRVARRTLPDVLRRTFKPASLGGEEPLRMAVSWMPATRYQRFWNQMPAFSLPSFYDGRIRVNLCGREAAGMIEASDYRRYCDELISTLRECMDPITGKPVVKDVEFGARGDPRHMGPTEADLIVLWGAAPLGLIHPDYGQIGPVPYRRTGGHTGERGFAYVHGSLLPAGQAGFRSAYDVVPTLIDLLGEPRIANFTGTSLLSTQRTAA